MGCNTNLIKSVSLLYHFYFLLDITHFMTLLNGTTCCVAGNKPSTISYTLPGCGDEQFECSDSSCIDMNIVCDGYDDCSHGEDEHDCPGK